jgi:MFS family permease
MAQTAEPRAGTFSSLRIQNFRYLWLGQVCHDAALHLEMVARPFLVLEMAAGPEAALHVAGVLAVRILPHVLLGAFAGVLSDFFDRRKILLIDKSAIAFLNVVFAALLVAGRLELWHVYAYGVLRGAMMAFDQPARQAMIPSIVPADRVTNALALMSATQNSMRILGQIAGGALYLLLGAAGSFVSIAVVYLGALIATVLLRLESKKRAQGTGAAQIASGLVEGLRFGARDPAVRGVLVLMLVFFAFCMSFGQVYLPLFAEQVLAVGPLGFSIYSALMGVGALGAALTIARTEPTEIARKLPRFVLGSGLLLIAFAAGTYAPGPARYVIPGVVVLGLGAMQTSFFALSRSRLLSAAPPELHGRVLGLLSFDRAFLTAGAAAGGFLVTAIGTQLAQIVYGVGAVSCALALLAYGRAFGLDASALPPTPAATDGSEASPEAREVSAARH